MRQHFCPQGLVVEQGDVEGAKRAVQRLLNERALREKLIKEGFETVKNWTWEISAKAMLELVEKKQGEVVDFMPMATPRDSSREENGSKESAASS